MNRKIDSQKCRICWASLDEHMWHSIKSCRSCPVAGKKGTWYTHSRYEPWYMTNLEYLEYKYEQSQPKI
jgi:hypothetical protein